MKPLFTLLLALTPALLLAQPPAGSQPPSRSQAFMDSLDSNKDGKVDKGEFLKPFEAQFEMMDQNKDGAIEKDEFEAIEKQMRERMQQMRQQQGQGKR